MSAVHRRKVRTCPRGVEIKCPDRQISPPPPRQVRTAAQVADFSALVAKRQNSEMNFVIKIREKSEVVGGGKRIKRFRFNWMTHINKRKKKKVPCLISLVLQWADHRFCVCRSEVGEAAGIFLVFIRDEENRFFKFVVMEFLKCHGGRDGGENRDVWRDKMPFLLY